MTQSAIHDVRALPAPADPQFPHRADARASEKGILLRSRSPSMTATLATLSAAASASVPVLLRGESGTGKGVLAEALHSLGSRATRPFVVVNCPALSDDLMTSELFGHARGAFTGAVCDKPGRVEAADGGTLFLDEIGDLSPLLQAKLLRFVQDGTFERLGEIRTRRANVRLVSATNRDLEGDVGTGRFRLDLFYRLSVIDVRVPALRERPEDLLPLAEYLLEVSARSLERPVPELGRDAIEALRAHPFPGNVRELKNEMERALVLSREPRLTAASFSPRLRPELPRPPAIGADFTLEEIERAHIERVLSRAESFESAARILGIDPSTLWRRRRRYAGQSLEESAALQSATSGEGES